MAKRRCPTFDFRNEMQIKLANGLQLLPSVAAGLRDGRRKARASGEPRVDRPGTVAASGRVFFVLGSRPCTGYQAEKKGDFG